MLSWVGVSDRHRRMMEGMRDALEAKLRQGLKASARVDSKGTLHGRVYTESVQFGAEFTFVRVKCWTSSQGVEECVVSVRTELLPRVNGFARYFPHTSSNRLVSEVDRISNKEVVKALGDQVRVTIDNGVGIDAAVLIAALGGLGALGVGLYGYLFTATTAGGLEGGAVGGAVAAGVMVVLIYRAAS